MRVRVLAICAALAASVALPASASASDLIDRNAVGAKLEVSRQGQALLTYRTRAGKLKHVLAWNAINALAPTRSRPQVSFKLDYSGGWGTYHRDVWKTFRNACTAYDGPPLAWSVSACTAADGSYWAVQSWQRALPDLGWTPWNPSQTVWELRLSHWTGPVAKLDVWLDWIYSGRFHDLFGRLTYRDNPVHGFRTTSQGAPLDTYGRNLYLDTFNSPHGQGWRRENSFVAHKGTGVFCYGFYPIKPYAGYPGSRGPQAGQGQKYRMTVIGPGVTPDVMWQGNGLHDFSRSNPDDVTFEQQQNAVLDQVVARDGLCHQH